MSSKYPASPSSSNENRFDFSLNNPTHVQFHQRRSPLNSIPDPSQLRQEFESDSDATKLDGADGSQVFDDKTSVSSSEGLVAVGKYVSGTPKVASRRVKVNVESNSAQSTPSRSCGFRGLGTGGKVYQSNGRRSSSRVSRRFTIVNTEQAEKVVDAPHFELEEDPLFWKDHNVQVLIRVRPLNNMERVLQGNARCLKQENAHALFWLGHPETKFTFDHIVCETITQEKLFRVAGLPMVENCMSGYNSCIFAYGQTGSGKTYTMMGEIHVNEGKLDQDCGITPRIFEFLFTKIKLEEESRRDEKLTYTCKCSFLEIYNEQITDLLEPSCTNLQLREDYKKGVYVENLTEHNVRTVNDVLQLLLKGAANRKIAATNMNSESSRSHSVFTCIIESRWEKDSMVHSRYGSLNLVDLAGSERQKSSGAEGDRLKEAANINKSLSTLGLVIMSLVDVAQGKQRHVPYRDSRLTFLLQDSLGGNSKTTIIANVSPSFCSATETLSTLKFAQRAKLIQNNAKVNEDASGDVTALQEQVQRLKARIDEIESEKIDYQMNGTTSLNSAQVLKELTDSRLSIEELECENIRLMQELQLTKERNQQLLDILGTENMQNCLSKNTPMELFREDFRSSALQAKLEKLSTELEEARSFNKQYQEAENLKSYHQKDAEIIREQVETETASTIIHLQEELSMLQEELHGKLNSMSAENSQLQNVIADKDNQLKEMSTQLIQWEKATLELTRFLMDGSKSLNHASFQIRSMSRLFPYVNGSLSESIEIAAQAFIEKEEMILLLQKSLQDAQRTVFEMEQKFKFLKGAAIAFNEAQHSTSTLCSEEQQEMVGKVCKNPELSLSECLSRLIYDTEAQANELAIGEEEEGEVCIDSTRLKLQELDDIFVKDVSACSGDNKHLKTKCNCLLFSSSEMAISDPSKEPYNNDNQIICIREGLKETNSRLGLIQASVSKLLEAYADNWESDGSTSDSSFSLTSTSADEKGICSGSASEHLHEVDGSALIGELKLASRGFRNLSVSLTSLVTQTDLTIKSHGENNQSLSDAVNNNLCGDASVDIIHRRSEMSCLPQSSNAVIQGASLDSTKNIPTDGKIEQSSSFISTFEEACATMKEADLMLNQLVKSNANAKQVTHMWRQVGKELKGERDCLFDQVQQLKSKLCSSKSEDDTLENEISDLIRVTETVSSLVDFFEDLQKDLEELFSGVHSDLLSMSKDVQSYVGSLRDLSEQICAEYIEKDFSSLVVRMCIGNSLSSIQGLIVHKEQASQLNEANSAAVNYETLSREQADKIVALPILEMEESLSQENLQLKRELQRKEVVLKGLLFDFSLLQEAASNRKDIRDEINKLILALGQAEFELQVKRHDVNSLSLQIREMEETLIETKQALAVSNAELEHTQRSVDTLSNDNNELRILVDDLHSRKSVAEKQLDEQDEVIKGLEKEILHLTSSASAKVFLSIETVERELLRVTAEREQLREEIISLTEKLEMACALAEENEALALEARQDSVASKIYSQQKEEEVEILEISIEELEDTVNVLEKKMQETDEEVQKHRLDRNSLETEIQALRQRMLTVEYLAENMDQEDSKHEKLENHIPRRLENQGVDLDQACAQIKVLKRIRVEQAKEINRLKEYVSELVLHAEAQASQYQEKYKTLEAMVHELKKKPSSMVSIAPVMERSERSSSRPRASSPFRCISNLVHQMNVEKDHELSTTKSRVEDLEVLAASRQKEVCMLSSRLAAAESMTHDVIRDLLGLKLDMTYYADLVDEHQLYSLLDVAQQKTVESERKEEEIRELRMQIRDLIDERDRFITEINRRESNALAAQMTLEQLKERDQYLTVQNEMLKVEKSNLMHRLVQIESRAVPRANSQSRGRR